MRSKKKIVKVEYLKWKIEGFRRDGKKIAFTNGCFDILHAGHVSYLETAKRKNRVLVVGLNSDSSIKKIKGPTRPINSQLARAAVLAALECVDYVVIFREETPYNLIKTLRPEILIKGADWRGKKVVGADIVAGYGGKVELIKYVSGFSTTGILQTVEKKCGK